MSNKFPTDYTDKGSADATDKVWASDGATNFNITVNEIWAKNFAVRTTDNLSEWAANLYASTENVDNAWAVMNTDASTAAMSFVVDEDDMVSDSPTKVPTQQSVKAYVDGQWIPITPLTEDTAPDMDADFNVEYDTTAAVNKKYKMSWYRASSAEATAWTSTTKFMTPENVKSNYGAWDSVVFSRDMNAVDATIVYNHNLWYIPKLITISALQWDDVEAMSIWCYSTVNNTNKCSWKYSVSTAWWFTTWSYCVYIHNTNDARYLRTWVVTNVTSTTFSISWVKWSLSYWTSIYCTATLI